jgi:hypothetical protein
MQQRAWIPAGIAALRGQMPSETGIPDSSNPKQSFYPNDPPVSKQISNAPVRSYIAHAATDARGYKRTRLAMHCAMPWDEKSAHEVRL